MPRCTFCEESLPTGAGFCPKCGAAVAQENREEAGTPSNISFEESLGEVARSGNKIEAIRLYREKTGVGLAEAKAAVEAFMAGHPIDVPGVVRERPIGLEGEILSLMQQGQKIQAIKLYREHTGTGLKEAKEAVEALAAQHGVVARQAGCLGMIVVAIALAGTAAAGIGFVIGG